MEDLFSYDFGKYRDLPSPFRSASQAVIDFDALSPMRYGRRPTVASTSQTLERWPSVVWDVNGYYASLGVHWWASRQQLRDAYVKMDGPNNFRLTYILKVLLDAELRAAYDSCPFGSFFFDLFLSEQVKRQRLDSQRNDHGHTLSEEEIQRLKDEGLLDEGVSTDDLMYTTVDAETGESSRDGYRPSMDWDWGHYVWGVSDWNDEVLQTWQRLLVQTAPDYHLTFAVGMMYDSFRTAVATLRLDDVDVFFLAYTQKPTLLLAHKAWQMLPQYRSPSLL